MNPVDANYCDHRLTLVFIFMNRSCKIRDKVLIKLIHISNGLQRKPCRADSLFKGTPTTKLFLTPFNRYTSGECPH